MIATALDITICLSQPRIPSSLTTVVDFNRHGIPRFPNHRSRDENKVNKVISVDKKFCSSAIIDARWVNLANMDLEDLEDRHGFTSWKVRIGALMDLSFLFSREKEFKRGVRKFCWSLHQSHNRRTHIVH